MGDGGPERRLGLAKTALTVLDLGVGVRGCGRGWVGVRGEERPVQRGGGWLMMMVVVWGWGGEPVRGVGLGRRVGRMVRMMGLGVGMVRGRGGVALSGDGVRARWGV